VGVRCPLEVVVRREAERRDRTLGQAAAQHDVIHRAGGYDVEVDTSVLDPEAAAEVVARRVAAGFPAMPFSKLGR
jgi:chloramphenicol 3-O phosphotransferase